MGFPIFVSVQKFSNPIVLIVKDRMRIPGTVLRPNSAKLSEFFPHFYKCCVHFFLALHQVLDETQNHKISLRVEEVLRRVSIGLQKNAVFLPEQMLVFVFGLVSERLPLLEKHQRYVFSNQSSLFIHPINFSSQYLKTLLMDLFVLKLVFRQFHDVAWTFRTQVLKILFF